MTWVELEGTANTRDIGGLRAAGGRVRSGLVLRSDNLQSLTANDVKLLIDDLALRTVLDLRTDAERAGEGPGPLANRPEVRHHLLSLICESGWTKPQAGDVLPDRWADGAVGAYLGYLHDRPEQVVSALRALADDTGGAAIVHCAAGKDRTGVVIAVLLECLGTPREQVIQDYVASDERVTEVISRLARSDTYRGGIHRIPPGAHRVDGAVLMAVLDVLDERYGGAAGYAASYGLAGDELTALRSRLVETA